MLNEEVWAEVKKLYANFSADASYEKNLQMSQTGEWSIFKQTILEPCLNKIRTCRSQEFCEYRWGFLGHSTYGQDYSEKGRAIFRFISKLRNIFGEPIEFGICYPPSMGAHESIYIYTNGIIIKEKGNLRDHMSSAYDYDFIAELPKDIEIPSF